MYMKLLLMPPFEMSQPIFLLAKQIKSTFSCLVCYLVSEISGSCLSVFATFYQRILWFMSSCFLVA